jgi:large subunit ribosomal protein L15
MDQAIGLEHATRNTQYSGAIMQIHDLKPSPGSHRRRKIVGRGPGSGHGKTATRGHKGQKKHGQVNPNFEGGQTPLHRRLPQLRGFKPVNKKDYAIINVRDLEKLEADAVVNGEALLQAGIIRDVRDGVKVLGDGELTKGLTVQAVKFSKTAIEKITAAGGTAQTV